MRDVVAGVGLGDCERDVHLAADDFGQVAAFLFLAAVKDQWTHSEDRQMNRAGRCHRSARGGYFTHHESSFGDAQAAAAVLLRNRDAQVARLGDRQRRSREETRRDDRDSRQYSSGKSAHRVRTWRTISFWASVSFKIHVAIPCQRQC